MRYLLLIGLMGMAGCGSIQKMAVRSSTPLFEKSTQRLTTENDWDFFRESTPGNLKFMEMLSQQDTKNTKLLGLLVKGYAGYAYAVPETLAFEDEINGVEDSKWRGQAINLYTRALDYGLAYLKAKGISHADLLSMDEAALVKKFNKELDEDDFTAVLYTAQAWGSLINLQKDNVALVSQVPKVKGMFDWVCGKNPSIDHGVCQIFYAQYEASRPRMLGGNPAKGEELYLKAIEANPKHLLMRVGYLQYSVLPAFDKDKYEQQATILREEFQKWSDLNRDTLENKSEYRTAEELNLYNAIAKKRFEVVERNKDKIF